MSVNLYKGGLIVTALLSQSPNGDTARHGRLGRYRTRGPISALLAQLPCVVPVGPGLPGLRFGVDKAACLQLRIASRTSAANLQLP